MRIVPIIYEHEPQRSRRTQRVSLTTAMVMQQHTRYLCALCVLCGCLLVGCEREEIKRYQVPREQTPVTEPTTQDDYHDHDHAPRMTYTVPDDWQDTGAAHMRVASFKAGDGADAVQVSITTFAGDVGGMAANVTRWARQAGATLAPGSDPADLAKPFEQNTDYQYVDLTGTNGRLYVILIPHRGATWFIKMTGSTEGVDAQLGNLRQFVRTVQFVTDHKGGAE